MKLTLALTAGLVLAATATAAQADRRRGPSGCAAGAAPICPDCTVELDWEGHKAISAVIKGLPTYKPAVDGPDVAWALIASPRPAAMVDGEGSAWHEGMVMPGLNGPSGIKVTLDRNQLDGRITRAYTKPNGVKVEAQTPRLSIRATFKSGADTCVQQQQVLYSL